MQRLVRPSILYSHMQKVTKPNAFDPSSIIKNMRLQVQQSIRHAAVCAFKCSNRSGVQLLIDQACSCMRFQVQQSFRRAAEIAARLNDCCT